MENGEGLLKDEYFTFRDVTYSPEVIPYELPGTDRMLPLVRCSSSGCGKVIDGLSVKLHKYIDKVREEYYDKHEHDMPMDLYNEKVTRYIKTKLVPSEGTSKLRPCCITNILEQYIVIPKNPFTEGMGRYIDADKNNAKFARYQKHLNDTRKITDQKNGIQKGYTFFYKTPIDKTYVPLDPKDYPSKYDLLPRNRERFILTNDRLSSIEFDYKKSEGTLTREEVIEYNEAMENSIRPFNPYNFNLGENTVEDYNVDYESSLVSMSSSKAPPKPEKISIFEADLSLFPIMPDDDSFAWDNPKPPLHPLEQRMQWKGIMSTGVPGYEIPVVTGITIKAQ